MGDSDENLVDNLTFYSTQASPWIEQGHLQTINPGQNVNHIVSFANGLQLDVTLNPDEHILQEAWVRDEVPRGRDQSMGTITCLCHVGTICLEPCVCPALCSHCRYILKN